MESKLRRSDRSNPNRHAHCAGNSLTNQINQAAATIAQFSSTITSLQQRTNSLDIVERAQIPVEPATEHSDDDGAGGLVGRCAAFGLPC